MVYCIKYGPFQINTISNLVIYNPLLNYNNITCLGVKSSVTSVPGKTFEKAHLVTKKWKYSLKGGFTDK